MGIIPSDYKSVLDVKETEKAIKMIKDHFQLAFSTKLNLSRVSAPLFVEVDTGLNDNLSGFEKAVSFNISAIDNTHCEVVHSLAKWKRMALHKYNYHVDEGIYTDMNAIRCQEDVLDNVHSVYVDQWDWERIISRSERNADFLKRIVEDIYSVIYDTASYVATKYAKIYNFLPEKITFVTSQQLEDMYPDMTPQEREDKAAKEFGAIFIMNIGGKLNSGAVHGLRAPDYDDWSLNGDIIVWYPILSRSVELSSMGIRVDSDSLVNQLKTAGITEYTKYHKDNIDGVFPLTIGGGIGQSRLCQVMLHKAHIGEDHSSLWPKETVRECLEKGVDLL